MRPRRMGSEDIRTSDLFEVLSWSDDTATPACVTSYMTESSENSSSRELSFDADETGLARKQRLARITFAGVLIALVVIYLVRNIDRFKDLRIESRYSELVSMVEPIEEAIEVALLSESAIDIEFLDSGEAGLPNEVLVSEESHGISVIDGRIIATWMKDESDLDGVTYILTPEVVDGVIEWATTGTCGGKKAC